MKKNAYGILHQLHLPHGSTIWQEAISQQQLIDDLDDIWNDIFEISQTEAKS